MSDAPLIGLQIDPDSPVPLFEQIYETLRRHITSGRIAAGSRLPPSRSLAQELGVSRTTVVVAYDQLVAEGFAQGRRGSGVYTSDIGTIEIDNAPTPLPRREPDVVPRPADAQPLQPGRPDMRQFPYRRWARCVARVARTVPEAMVVRTDPFGDPPLRAAISRYLAEWRGLNASPDRILITAGAGDALETCIRALAREGNAIALEDPGYPPLRTFVRGIGMRTIWLGVDSDGAMLPAAPESAERPVLTVLTPSSQFPLGGAMPTRRRMDFLQWAEAHGGWIVEDDYDSEFRYAGRPIPALASFDGVGRAIYIGSFSKVFSETMRLGFLVVPETLIGRFSNAIRAYGTRASLMPQRALAVFMEDGEFYRHLRRMRRVYSERRRTLVSLLRRELGPLATFEDHQAGMHIALLLPDGIDDTAISAQAAARGVACPTLSSYFASPPGKPGLLLGFCGFAPDEMEGPVTVLRDLLRAMA